MAILCNLLTCNRSLLVRLLRDVYLHPPLAVERCRKQTVGLLQPRHIEIQEISGIGKESNSLEEVESGLIHSSQNVYTEYPDPQRDEWQTEIVPALRKIPLSRLEKLSGMSRRALIYARVGHMRPHKKGQEILTRIVQRYIRQCPTRNRKNKNFMPY